MFNLKTCDLVIYNSFEHKYNIVANVNVDYTFSKTYYVGRYIKNNFSWK